MAFEKFGRMLGNIGNRAKRSVEGIKQDLRRNRSRYEIVKGAPSERVRQKLRMVFDHPVIRPWMFFNVEAPLGYKRHENPDWDIEAWDDPKDVLALLRGLNQLYKLEIHSEARASQEQVIHLIENELRYRSEEMWKEYKSSS